MGNPKLFLRGSNKGRSLLGAPMIEPLPDPRYYRIKPNGYYYIAEVGLFKIHNGSSFYYSRFFKDWLKMYKMDLDVLITSQQVERISYEDLVLELL